MRTTVTPESMLPVCTLLTADAHLLSSWMLPGMRCSLVPEFPTGLLGRAQFSLTRSRIFCL